jgi:hypothetical protein
MNAQPTVRCAGTLVVLEGSARVSWRRAAAAEWVPIGVWPSAEQADEVVTRIARNEQVLILLSSEPSRVDLMAEEFAAAPAAVKALAVEPEADPVTLAIPELNWLPQHLQERGLRFGRQAAAIKAATPRALLPPLLLEPPHSQASSLRFGLQRSSAMPLGLAAVVRAAFPAADSIFQPCTASPSVLEVWSHAS